MRYAFILLILVLATGCANNRLRLIKVDKTERIEVAQKESDSQRTPYSGRQQEVILVSEETTTFATATSEQVTENTQQTAESTASSDTPEPKSIESNSTAKKVLDQVPDDGLKVDAALKAEKQAKSAKLTLIASLISFILPIFSIFSLPLFIVGSILLAISNRSNYITPAGARYARAARIAQIIYLVLILLGIALILAFIFL
jgi:hypothetical protein